MDEAPTEYPVERNIDPDKHTIKNNTKDATFDVLPHDPIIKTSNASIDYTNKTVPEVPLETSADIPHV